MIEDELVLTFLLASNNLFLETSRELGKTLVKHVTLDVRDGVRHFARAFRMDFLQEKF